MKTLSMTWLLTTLLDFNPHPNNSLPLDIRKQYFPHTKMYLFPKTVEIRGKVLIVIIL